MDGGLDLVPVEAATLFLLRPEGVDPGAVGAPALARLYEACQRLCKEPRFEDVQAGPGAAGAADPPSPQSGPGGSDQPRPAVGLEGTPATAVLGPPVALWGAVLFLDGVEAARSWGARKDAAHARAATEALKALGIPPTG